MKKLIALVVIMMVAVAAAGSAEASHKKKHSSKAKQHSSTSDVNGGGYYGGKYHIQKQGKADKLDLKWGGVENPIKGMKESAHKPPATTPSRSPNN